MYIGLNTILREVFLQLTPSYGPDWEDMEDMTVPIIHFWEYDIRMFYVLYVIPGVLFTHGIVLIQMPELHI